MLAESSPVRIGLQDRTDQDGCNFIQSTQPQKMEIPHLSGDQSQGCITPLSQKLLSNVQLVSSNPRFGATSSLLHCASSTSLTPKICLFTVAAYCTCYHHQLLSQESLLSPSPSSPPPIFSFFPPTAAQYQNWRQQFRHNKPPHTPTLTWIQRECCSC